MRPHRPLASHPLVRAVTLGFSLAALALLVVRASTGCSSKSGAQPDPATATTTNAATANAGSEPSAAPTFLPPTKAAPVWPVQQAASGKP